MQVSFRHLFLLLIVVGLYGCKSSRQASSRSAPRTTGSSSTVNTPSSRATVNYPASEYYGSNWNTQHIRLNADPKPTGSVQLTLLRAGEQFRMPTCGRILSEFGYRNGSMHTGIDIKLEMNDPVYAAFDGMVRMAQEYGAYGKMVVIRHENGLETVYGHLNSIAVKRNQRVKAGDRLGGGGRTGRATGTHLHFETRFKGEPFNPRLLINMENCRLSVNQLTLSKESYNLHGRNVQETPQTADATKNTANSKVQQHTVQRGDTLYNISRRYNTTVARLCQLNNIKESSVLKIGQVLRVR